MEEKAKRMYSIQSQMIKRINVIRNVVFCFLNQNICNNGREEKNNTPRRVKYTNLQHTSFH